jgi:hypothetical protein
MRKLPQGNEKEVPKAGQKRPRQSWRGELDKFFKALVLAWGFIIIIIAS